MTLTKRLTGPILMSAGGHLRLPCARPATTARVWKRRFVRLSAQKRHHCHRYASRTLAETEAERRIPARVHLGHLLGGVDRIRAGHAFQRTGWTPPTVEVGQPAGLGPGRVRLAASMQLAAVRAMLPAAVLGKGSTELMLISHNT